MAKQHGYFQFSRNNQVPKALMGTRKIFVRDSFDCCATMWVPKASLQKPQPLISISITTADSSARLSAPTSEELKNALLEMVAWIDEVGNEFEEAQGKESEKWVSLHKAYQEEIESRKAQKNAENGKVVRIKKKTA